MSMRTILVVFFVAAIACSAIGSADALTIRSWDDATQRGGDLFNAGSGITEYGALETALVNAGHTVLPGVSVLTAANLAGVNVFFHGASSHLLSGSEQAALASFIQNGGYLIVEANSIATEQQSANTALGGLGLGSPYNGATGGSQSATAGRFGSLEACTTVGPYGDLRGLTFGSSLCTDITPGAGIVVGMNDNITCMVEFMPYAVGGKVLACGDPYGFNLFTDPGGGSYNINNLNAYLNFIECQGTIPVEATTWGAVKSTFSDN
jgi:hypothetical protein